MPSGSSTTSVATISAAPWNRAAATTRAPIGPQPVTSTRRPISGPARDMACSATENGSASASSPAGTCVATSHCTASQTSRSRKPPWICGIGMALP